MRQVRECDFCNEGASGVYEPLPASIDPDGPRLLLCEGCRGRLAAVVEPLLDRVDADAGGGAFEPDGATGEAADSAAGVSGRAAGDVGGTTPEASGTAVTGDDGRTDDGTGAAAAVGGESDGAGAAASGGVDAGGRSGEEREGAPRGYRKVMRFLENRTFPMDREEAQRLAAEAYDLDENTVSAAVDHAVRYGRLREVRGELKR